MHLLKEEECHLYFRNENKLTVINGKGLESDYDKRQTEHKSGAAMGHGFELEMVTGNRTCNG